MLAASIVDTRRIYDWVLDIYVPIAIGVFALFTGLIICVIVWHRTFPRALAGRRHEANVVEGGYALLLTCVAAFLLWVTFTAEHRDDTANLQRPALTIDVTGARWEWIFRYPRYGITHQSGAVGNQPLVVPANEPIRFNLRSVDVIHSLWIPQLRFKRDAIPGAVERVTLDFDRVGRFSGSCAEFCGLLHAEMVFTVDVVTQSAFRAWAASGGRTGT